MQFGIAAAQYNPYQNPYSNTSTNSSENTNTRSSGKKSSDSYQLKSAITKSAECRESITEAFGPYKFGMSMKDFNKATKQAIKEKKASRNAIGNVEYVLYFPDGRPYSVILANAAFYQDKLCGLDFVFERFDTAISEIIYNEIMEADRFSDMEKYEKTDGVIFIKDNLQVILSPGSMSYVNSPVISHQAQENENLNTSSRRAF